MAIIRTENCLSTQVQFCSYTPKSLNTQKQYNSLLLEIVKELGYKLVFDDNYFKDNNFVGLHIYSEKIIAFKELNMFGTYYSRLEEDYEYLLFNKNLQHELTHVLQKGHVEVILPKDKRISSYEEYTQAIATLLGNYFICPHEQSLNKGWKTWLNNRNLYTSNSFSWEIPAYYLENDLEAFLALFQILNK